MNLLNNRHNFKVYRALTDRGIYYSEERGALISNTINDLKQELNPELNKKAIDLFLTLRYIPAPYTIYTGIKKLPVIHSLEAEEGKVKIRERKIFYNAKDSYKKLVCEAKKALFDCVSREVEGEKKVGLLLSGGIDSSSILAVLSKLNVEVLTYTLGFDRRDPDLLISRKLAEHFHTKHKEIILKDFPKETFDKVISKMDEPVADPTYIPVRTLAEKVDNEVKKIFVGEGGDEIFGGYPEFRYLALAKFARYLPQPLRAITYCFRDSKTKNRISKFLQYYPSYSKAFLYLKSVFTPEQKRQLYTKDFMEGLEVENGKIFAFNKQFEFSQNVINFYLKSQLSARLISKYPQDTKYKFYFPMLSNQILSLMIEAPIEYKFNLISGRNKIILRAMLKGLLPQDILNRRKRGFTVPIAQWMKGSLKKEIERVLSKEQIQNNKMFNWDFVKLIVDNHNKSFYWRNKLWSLFTLEKWLAAHC